MSLLKLSEGRNDLARMRNQAGTITRRVVGISDRRLVAFEAALAVLARGLTNPGPERA